jgi:hypothetical protein
MLRVTVELLPKGNEALARKLATLEIANDGTGTQDVGHYKGTLHAEYTPASGRTGRVLEFNRRRQSVWSLVGAFLKLFGHTTHSPSKMTVTSYEQKQDTLL